MAGGLDILDMGMGPSTNAQPFDNDMGFGQPAGQFDPFGAG